jgi:bla regulator protein BlaR1
LIPEQIIPHSFFKYIFFNKAEYVTEGINKQLLLHELTHVRQRHSLDIMFIELLKIIFWFNPMFILYKRAIQLNHEFLADDGVLTAYIDLNTYQHLLLSKAGFSNMLNLTSNFNYSITKKRLLMMTTTTSTLRAMLKGIALVPLMLALIFALCLKENADAQTPVQTKSHASKQITSSTTKAPVVIYKDHYDPDSVSITFVEKDGTKTVKRLSELSAEKQKRFAPFAKKYSFSAKKTPTTKQLNSWKDASVYGVWIDGKHVKNEVLNNYEAKYFSLYYNSKLYGVAKKGKTYSYQLDLYSDAYYEKVKKEIDDKNATKTTTNIYSMIK